MASKEWKEKNVDRMREYRRDWYKRNKDKAKNKIISRRNQLEKWFQQLKTTLKCNRCGENTICCLLFHHTNPKEKECGVAIAVHRGWSKNHILEEIAKCEVLCFNCHAKIHYTGVAPTG